jgi:hypothetical protein
MRSDEDLDYADEEDSHGRAYLEVPFAEKEIVKSLGAKWDSANNAWYVRAGGDLTPFAQWRPIWPYDNDPVVKVLGLPMKCWKCHSPTLAVIACQNGDQLMFAHAVMLQVLASQLEPEELAAAGAGPLRPRYASTSGQSSWSNGCVECGALLGGAPLWESFNAFISQGQENLPGITFAQVPVDILRAPADFV